MGNLQLGDVVYQAVDLSEWIGGGMDALGDFDTRGVVVEVNGELKVVDLRCNSHEEYKVVALSLKDAGAFPTQKDAILDAVRKDREYANNILRRMDELMALLEGQP